MIRFLRDMLISLKEFLFGKNPDPDEVEFAKSVTETRPLQAKAFYYTD